MTSLIIQMLQTSISLYLAFQLMKSHFYIKVQPLIYNFQKHLIPTTLPVSSVLDCLIQLNRRVVQFSLECLGGRPSLPIQSLTYLENKMKNETPDGKQKAFNEDN
jgi:hypothetical protein